MTKPHRIEINDFETVKPGDVLASGGKRFEDRAMQEFNHWAVMNFRDLYADRTRLPYDTDWRMLVMPIGQIMRLGCDVPASSLIAAWIGHRVRFTDVAPDGGWYQVSALHADFKKWFIESGGRPGLETPVNIFGRWLKRFPGVKTVRRATGSLAIGITIEI